MAHTIERSLSSLTALAAASLFLSTSAPALAQSQDAAQPSAATTQTAPAQTAPAQTESAAPAPVAQTPAAPDAAAPTQSSPDAAVQAPAPTMTAAPVVQPLPDNSQTATTPAPTARTLARPAQTTPRAIPETRAPSLRPAAITAPTTPAPKANPAPVTTSSSDTSSSGLMRRDPAGLYTANGAPVAAASAPAPAAVKTQPSPFARYWPLEAAGAIVLIGLAGYAVTRRRDEEEEEYAPAETFDIVEEPAAPALAPAMAVNTAATHPATLAPEPLTTAHSANLTLEEAPSVSILPAGPVPTGEARMELLNKMVAAQPDAANPFLTVKARMRRARMILSARKQALHEKATETFDWRTYRPSLTAYNLTHPTLGEPTLGDPLSEQEKEKATTR